MKTSICILASLVSAIAFGEGYLTGLESSFAIAGFALGGISMNIETKN
jgi:hypothetical protein